jgi:hypothetical protein
MAPDDISGAELAERTRRQALKFGCEIFQLQYGVYANLSTEKSTRIWPPTWAKNSSSFK